MAVGRSFAEYVKTKCYIECIEVTKWRYVKVGTLG